MVSLESFVRELVSQWLLANRFQGQPMVLETMARVDEFFSKIT